MPLTALPDQIIDRLDLLGLEPLKAFRFAVEIDSLPQGARFVAGFSRVEGLEARTEVDEIREGGYRGVHRYPRRQVDGPVKLFRLMTPSRHLWNWYQACACWSPGKPDFTRSVSIWMIDAVGVPGTTQEATYEVCRWNLYRAWASQWLGPPLDALSEQSAVEGVELQHQGLTTDKGLLDGTAADIIGVFGQR